MQLAQVKWDSRHVARIILCAALRKAQPKLQEFPYLVAVVRARARAPVNRFQFTTLRVILSFALEGDEVACNFTETTLAQYFEESRAHYCRALLN